MNRQNVINCGVVLGLIAVAALSRLIGAQANFAAVASVALFAGFFFRSRLLAVSIPLMALLISDLVIGFYDWREMLVAYMLALVPVLMRTLIARDTLSSKAKSVFTLACVNAAIFFVFSNLAVWAFGTLYAHSADGLIACYIKAIPFALGTLASNLVYSLGLFGLHHVCQNNLTVAPAEASAIAQG